MIINEAYINGFGLYNDISIKGFSPGLTLFFGKNESGKSSLLAFIRAILLGFPDGRRKENTYPPLSGGNHGGNITVTLDSNDQYIIERYPGPGGGKVEVLSTNGIRGGKEMLNRLLSIGDPSLFSNIYAFGLSELQNFETLNNDTVEEALYSAGAGLNPQSLSLLKASLEKREEDLFKPKGSRGKINRILSRIADIKREKKGLSFNLDEYDRAMNDMHRLGHEIRQLEEEKVNLAILAKKLGQQSDIFPVWIDLNLLRQRIDEIEKVDSFPVDGILRYDNLKNRLFDLSGEYQEKKENITGLESKLSGLKGLGLVDKSGGIKGLSQNRGLLDSLERDIFSVSQEISSEEGRLEERIKGLGSGWDEKKIRDFNLSIAAGEDARGFREKLNNMELEIRSIKDRLGEIISGKKEAEAALNSIPAPEIKDKNLFREFKAALRSLKSLHNEDILIKKDLKHISERLDEFYTEKKGIVDKLTVRTFFLPMWLVVPAIAAGLSLLGMYYYYNRNIENMAGAVFLLIAAAVLWLIHNRMLKTVNRNREELKASLLSTEEKINELEKGAENIKWRINTIQEEIESDRVKLSLGEKITEELIDKKGDELFEQESLFEKRQDIEQGIYRTGLKYTEAEEKCGNITKQRDTLIKDWQEWLHAHDLGSGLSPDGAIETLDIIRNSAETVGTLIQLRQKKASIEKQKDEFYHQANRLLSECGRGPVQDEKVPEEINRLLQDYEKDEEITRDRELLNNRLALDRAGFEKLLQQISALEAEIKDLFTAAEANNEDQFRQRGKCFEERQRLAKDIEIHSADIRRLAGSSGNVDKILEEISHLDLSKLEGEKSRVEEELKDKDLLLDIRKKEQARLEERVRLMVKDDELSKLRADEEDLREELSALSEEWITIRFAKGLFSRAMARYEKERQPGVISEASKLLNRMTMGKYPDIVAPLGENRIEIVDTANNRKGIDQLSRGTAEQLYLALRFGFIREFAKRSESMPVIMDEILVNFDRERAGATISGILELAENFQILYFTCHPYIIDLFSEADRNIPVMEISGGRITIKQ